jgi:hydroxymethylpyrimidine/phosphomethylpyrimidine kinase
VELLTSDRDAFVLCGTCGGEAGAAATEAAAITAWNTRADPALAAAQAEIARYKVAMIVAGAEIDAHKAEVVRLTAEVARLRGPVTTYKRGYGPGDGYSAALAAVSIGENDD